MREGRKEKGGKEEGEWEGGREGGREGGGRERIGREGSPSIGSLIDGAHPGPKTDRDYLIGVDSYSLTFNIYYFMGMKLPYNEDRFNMCILLRGQLNTTEPLYTP